MPRWFWVAVSLGITCFWPVLLPVSIAARGGLIALMLALVVFSRRRTSSAELGYLEGQLLIAGRFACFSDTLTSLYLGNILFFMQLAAFALALGPNARRNWRDFIRGVYEWRNEESFADAVRALRRPPEVLDPIPRTTRPWYARYLLLYVPREPRTLMMHLGFYAGLFIAAASVAIPFIPEAREQLAMEPHELAVGILIYLGVALYCWRTARIKDAKSV